MRVRRVQRRERVVLPAMQETEAAMTDSGWISWEDRLPDDNSAVFVHDKDCGVTIGAFERIYMGSYKGTWYDITDLDPENGGHYPLWKVTHWRPISFPEPPQ